MSHQNPEHSGMLLLEGVSYHHGVRRVGPGHQIGIRLVRLNELQPRGISELRTAGVEPFPTCLYLFWNVEPQHSTEDCGHWVT